MSTSLSEWAVRYAIAGWGVMPLVGIREVNGERMCTCWSGTNCISPGKHPTTTNGLFDSTTDPAIVRSWWQARPYGNIGLRTGGRFDVLDIDGPTGLASLTEFLPEPLAWPGPVASTGKGFHLYVRPTGLSNTAHIRPGLDFRGDGGYVVAPPSVHLSGNRYEWVKKAPLPDAPVWLIELLDPPGACQFRLKAGKCGKLDPHAHRGYLYEGPGVQQLEVAL